jgi:hypothetical protein
MYIKAQQFQAGHNTSVPNKEIFYVGLHYSKALRFISRAWKLFSVWLI